MRWAAILVPSLILYFAPVAPFSPQQRHLLAVFLGTIIALVAQPVPMGVSVTLAMTILAIARILPPAKVLSGFSNLTVWLIFSAFLFARAVTTTGLGTRIAYTLIRAFGRGPLSLGYCVATANIALAPFVPSDTARGGGVIFPITRSLAQAFGSEPGPATGNMGSYLMLVGFHSTYVASGMFLTSMAANPLIGEFAAKIGHVQLTWIKWAMASSLPGFLTVLIVPWVLTRLSPPGVRDMAPARALAVERLAEIGRVSRREASLVVVLIAVMAGWVTSPWHSIPNAFVALAGLCGLLLMDVLTWDDLLSEKKAWDALVWFAPLLMMADALNEAGIIGIFSNALFGLGLPLVGLVVAYLYIHYTFASMTAHATALYPGFLGAAIAGGANPLIAALALAFASNLDAGLTHYGTGSAPVFFGAGYITQSKWWKVGFLVSVVNLIIWLGVGIPWWKLLNP